uniref:Mitochondrial transcription termination factor 1 n=1 Tax=Takifugu rubripes TaxID=31033 RepID=A0A674NM59_TAKRU
IIDYHNNKIKKNYFTCFTRKLCSSSSKSNESKLPVNSENQSLLENLNLLGVDLTLARQRQPGVLRNKGASGKVIASIITRYPRAVTRSFDHLNQRWELWRNIFKTDAEIVSILERSPESFFRSSDNNNLEKNITFLTSLGLTPRDLHRLLTTAPRTFSNRLELNKEMVKLLQEICAKLGYLSIEILKSLQQKLYSLGCQEAGYTTACHNYPMVLYIGSSTLISKLDCLLNGGITMKQILEKPRDWDMTSKRMALMCWTLAKRDFLVLHRLSRR